jgi:putative NADH-flavin reductase
MVNIALFGATGACGSFFLEHALAANHSIVMLARIPSEVSITNDNLKVVQGDAPSDQDVKAVCEGCDVVVSCTGNSKNK